MFRLGFDTEKKTVVSGFTRREPDAVVQKNNVFISIYKTGDFVGVQFVKPEEAPASNLGMSF